MVFILDGFLLVTAVWTFVWLFFDVDLSLDASTVSLLASFDVTLDDDVDWTPIICSKL